ncbi:DUF1801 domain-containing protein [Pollutibacter soli]|uniref:iron chaperone n=1 Tax=Pollutibacter soli TaxID=3034157 RepID=UPI0030138F65
MATSTKTKTPAKNVAEKKSASKKPATKKTTIKKSSLPKAQPVKPKGITVEDYILAQPPDSFKALTEVRKRIRKVIPKAEEVIWYNIPTYKIDGKALLCFAGFKQHCSIVTMNHDVTKILKEDLKDFKKSGTTIHFTSANVPTVALISKIVNIRLKQV